MKGFARREFQLMLLRRMADFQPDLVEAACAELSASHAQYMDAHNRWQTMQRSRSAPKGLLLYEAVLGPADERREVPYGDAVLTAHRWRLPGLWPELRWEALVGTEDFVLHGWLVRSADSAVPELGAAEGLAPWSCVVDDVLARFPKARQRDPETPARWGVDVPDDDGGVCRLMFVHGLLQQVAS
ncbi:hypothetical protein [Catellatospora vulcania]|uniref:hypothetical protein n=1 Tax=Catellatospora vulcania TaxID=1460450 RepID=UPI0012D37B94|nr:hypothetical protein [Catellatospora vulcania]